MNNTKAIDDYLVGNMAPGDALLFEANMLLNNDLWEDVLLQQRTHAVVKEYGRQNIRAEITAVQQILSTVPQHSGFMQRIANFFKK